MKIKSIQIRMIDTSILAWVSKWCLVKSSPSKNFINKNTRRSSTGR